MEWNRVQEERLAVLTALCARALEGSLSGTALMKLCYFLQALKEVPLGYHFTLYSYGPFDSEVLSDLGTAESLGALRSTVEYYPGGYGYRIQTAERASAVMDDGANFLSQHRAAVDWVAEEFGSLDSAALELRSTIVFADREAFRANEALTLSVLSERVRNLEPHAKSKIIFETVDRLFEKGLLHSSKPATAAA